MDIEEMNFDQLKALLAEYDDILPEGALESPEQLLEALETISKEQIGYSHRYNARAYKILRASVYMPSTIMTVKDLSEKSGLSRHTVSDFLYRCNKYHYKYFTRLQKRTSNHECRYKLRKWGIRTYIDMHNRTKNNFSLRRHKYIHEKVDCYYSVNKYGRLMGLTQEELPKSL